MNIFFLDQSPEVAAQYLFDRHIVKMPVETCTMLANAYSPEVLQIAPKTQGGKIRGHSWKHHGCTKWVVRGKENFNWLVRHGLAMCIEYTYRYGKEHFCSEFIAWCSSNTPNIPEGWTSPFLAMPEEHKSADYVLSYRNYYKTKHFDKSGKDMFIWQKRQRPQWL